MIVVILLIVMTMLIAGFAAFYICKPKFKLLVEAPKYQVLEQEERIKRG